MFNYIWPIAVLVLSNVIYQICAKSIPSDLNPFASLTVTYLVAAVCSAALYILLGKQPDPLREIGKMNWAPYVLGMMIVGLEVGSIYAYRAGWQVSTVAIVQSSFWAVLLLVIGAIFYHEALTWNKIVGVLICLTGLIFINLR